MNARPRRVEGTSVRARALAVLLVASSTAAWPGDAADASGPALIEALRANGAQVVSLGSRGGLDGYFVTPGDGAGYGLYVTGDGHAVAGLLYGPDGREVTGAQLAAAHAGEAGGSGAGTGARESSGPAVSAHAAPPGAGAPTAAASRAALFERSAVAFGFTLGERGPVVVLLGDAACPWSRSAAAKLGREALGGRLQLRVVPVAILGADAARRAAAIAAHPDPARSWFEGPEHPADRAGAERIARNNALLDAWGATAVPLIAWTARDGGVRHRIGDIDDVGAWLKETLGPETPGPETPGPETFVPYILGAGDTRAGDTRAGDTRAGDARAGHPEGGRRP